MLLGLDKLKVGDRFHLRDAISGTLYPYVYVLVHKFLDESSETYKDIAYEGVSSNDLRFYSSGEFLRDYKIVLLE